MNWENKKIIITGGSSGIGAQLVGDLNDRGAMVVFCGLEEDNVKNITQKYNVKGITTNLRKEEELVSFFESSISYLGGIDILINNAGYVVGGDFQELKRDDFEHMFAINAIAPARLAQLALPYFKKKEHGDIVNIGATGGHYAFPKGTAYSASKAALNIISKNLMLEHRKDNIRTFHIDPSKCTDTNNDFNGGPFPKDEEKLNPSDISCLIMSILEMDRRAFVPELSVWATQP